MVREQSVTVDLVKGSNNEYIIRDKVGITIGRVFVIELSKENRYCNFRIKFYKKGSSSYNLLRESINIFLRSLFRNMDIYKVNVLADEDINIMAFTDLGFVLEGIISSRYISKGEHSDELLFGVDFDSFRNEYRFKEFELIGKNISLGILNPNDAEDVLDYYIKNRKHLMMFEPDRDESFYTLDGQRRNLIEGYKQFINGDSVNFGIYKRDKFIGKIQISNIVMGVFKNAFVGYSIDENEQGNGYMKEALRLVMDYAYNDMGLHRLEASTLIDNIKSQKVLEACGFEQLGVSKKYLFINNAWKDHMIFYRNR